MILAQISDTHIKRKGKLLHHMINTAKYLRRTVERLNTLDPRPDAVIATGDLVDSGDPREYKRLRKLLGELDMPVYAVPGNHDEREAFREAFKDQPYLPKFGPLQYAIDDLPVRLIALDTVSADNAWGELDDERLDWLSARLEEAPDRPTLVFMHHPPFKTGIRAMDMPFRGVDGLGAIVQRYPNIERIVCGHIHRPMQVRWHGTIACTAPSTAHQLVLELREKQPIGVTLQSPGYNLHVWSEGVMVTHECLVKDKLAFID
jgi:3',5'-cyclic AMP phosphodiesterase CpdA